MNKYGLNRGIEGSEARHISTQQFYRELFVQNENLKENIEVLQGKKEEVYEKVRDMYDRKDEARNKFLDMDKHLHQKEQELLTVEAQLQKAKQDYEPYKAQEEMNLIYFLFPIMKENLRIAELCSKIGLAIDSIKALFEGKTLTAKSFFFFSPEHNQKFMADDVRLKIEKEKDNPNKLRLNLNGMNILEWFKQKYRELHKGIHIHNNINVKEKNRFKL